MKQKSGRGDSEMGQSRVPQQGEFKNKLNIKNVNVIFFFILVRREISIRRSGKGTHIRFLLLSDH